VTRYPAKPGGLDRCFRAHAGEPWAYHGPSSHSPHQILDRPSEVAMEPPNRDSLNATQIVSGGTSPASPSARTTCYSASGRATWATGNRKSFEA
jgi:hypothetical protein